MILHNLNIEVDTKLNTTFNMMDQQLINNIFVKLILNLAEKYEDGDDEQYEAARNFVIQSVVDFGIIYLNSNGKWDSKVLHILSNMDADSLFEKILDFNLNMATGNEW